MAALLHDAMEDCGVTKMDLIERFGPVAELVDGLTKLDKLEFDTREENQAESVSARCCWPWRATCVSSSSNWPTARTTCARCRTCRAANGAHLVRKRWKSTPRLPTAWA